MLLTNYNYYYNQVIIRLSIRRKRGDLSVTLSVFLLYLHWTREDSSNLLNIMASAADADTATTDNPPAPKGQQLFKVLDASNIEELETSEIESLCVQCEENVNLLYICNYNMSLFIIGHNSFAVDQDTNVP